MTREPYIEKKLSDIDADTGDIIRIARDDDVYEGSLMPYHEFSGSDIVTIKLGNGYNIGIAITEGDSIELVKKADTRENLPRDTPSDSDKPLVSVVGTGGTIACYIDYRTGAVHPATSAKQLAFSIPEIFDICNVNTQVAYQILSEHTTPMHWQKLAKIVADELNKGVKGVIIPHGTDTMGYTAAALTFMLGHALPGPVVLVGAQRSSDRPSSDAAQNMFAAAMVASRSDIGEVVCVMHSESSDTTSTIHRGTRVRKFHTSRRDAFKTINDKSLGIVDGDKIRIDIPYEKAVPGNKVKPRTDIDTDVSMIYSYPGMRPDDVPKRKGMVIMGTGLGHVPGSILPNIKERIDAGSIVVMSSQCIFGRINMAIYSTGRDQMKAGIISCNDMLAETAYVKLMWALANTDSIEEAKKMMDTNLHGEFTERSRSDVYF